MGRRRGLVATPAQIQREAARAEAARRRAQSASRREAEQARLRHARATVADACERNLAPDIHRIMAAVSVDGGRFADVNDLRIAATVVNPPTHYVFQPAATVETALVCLEIYRHDGTWRLRAIGQGYTDGLPGSPATSASTLPDPA